MPALHRLLLPASQQLKPKDLIALLDKLDIDTYEKIGGSTNILYDGIQKQLSLIDNEIIYLIIKRMGLIKQLKTENVNVDFSKALEKAEGSISQETLKELFDILNR